MLTHSKFKQAKISENPSEGMCKSCGNCTFCNNFLEEASEFSSYHTNKTYKIKSILTCKTECIVYMIQDLVCNKTSIGSTYTDMCTRWGNHKSHIKRAYLKCEIARHFNDPNSGHTLDTTSQIAYTNCLKEQLKVIIIEKVVVNDNDSKETKIKKCEKREGYWQTQLKCMTRYGGLNIRDNRKISNNATRS